MRRARASLFTGLGLVVVLVALTCLIPRARAEFTHASLLSGTAQMQFEEANAPALSADGRYAVFQGRLAGASGVYRRDLQSGAIAQVAGADAAAPSVSADGRYVAFTTTADLDPGAEPAVDGGCPQVYVRDMDVPPGEPGEYTLATELNETSEGIAYEGGCGTSGPGSIDGAQAAAGVALSADGRHVVFTVLSESNLEGPGTAPGEVAVRDLDAHTTTLVTITSEGRPVAGGGAFPSTESLADGNTEPVGLTTPQFRYGDQAAASTAAISADASTVAWLGTNVQAQVPPIEAEREPRLRAPLMFGREAEPLWRRVANGQSAVTRRLLAGAGLDFFYSRANEPTNPVLAGSLVGNQGSVFIAPVLSGDGRTAAMIASAPPPSVEPSLTERVNPLSGLNTDAYAVRVDEGAESAAAVTPLTEITSYALPNNAIEDVKDVAISPDGTRVAFDTARTQLRLPALSLISPPSAFTQTAETYEANLELGTLQRVTSTYDGSEPGGDAGLLSLSGGQGGAGGATTVAFASRATNLFFGDGVPAWEVYAASEIPSQAAAAPEEIGPAPNPQLPSPTWTLSATATAEPDGSALVVALTPGAGRLAVRAGAQLPRVAAKTAHRRLRAKRARISSIATAASTPTVVHGKPKRREHAGKKSVGTAIAPRTVADVGATARGAQEVRVRVRVGAAYRALVAGYEGLYAVLRITFAAPGHKTLLEEVPVTFRLTQHERASGRVTHKRVKR
ncbi:MAG TPA: hypothetical protein VGH60_00300 [Solirubrobacteraceae bacterium]|jgi:hypothetical protein